MTITIELKGKPNLGLDLSEQTESFTVEKASDSVIHVKDEEGNILISFNPFLDGGSVCIENIPTLVLENHENLMRNRFFVTSTVEIKAWQKDSERLEKLREAKRTLRNMFEESE